MNIAENLKRVRYRIQNTCSRVGRNEDDVILIAVSKTVNAEAITTAVECGVKHIGENRIQEAEKKINQLGNVATWHLIGHLQTNKVKKAVQLFNFIHSVDSLRLAQEISRRAVQFEKEIQCLIEVNTSLENSKFGVAQENTLDLVKQISLLPGIRVQGLMTVGAFLPDPEDVRPCFKILKNLSEQIVSAGLEGVEMKYLSMGMTNDFEVAIEEGANMIRVGRAIFGERNY